LFKKKITSQITIFYGGAACQAFARAAIPACRHLLPAHGLTNTTSQKIPASPFSI
jgi:hypothetical protein